MSARTPPSNPLVTQNAPSSAPPPVAPPRRPAWVEIDLGQLDQNLALIQAQCPSGVRLLSVIKDDAYGHGAAQVARAALQRGAAAFGVVTIDEAVALREAGIRHPILLFAEREPEEFEACVDYDLASVVTRLDAAQALAAVARARNRRAAVHLKVNTGMNRFGIDWPESASFVEDLSRINGLRLDGVMSHFAMSDELDKTFALEQLARFQRAIADIAVRGVVIPLRHFCNSGGFLDLPQAHFDMVRVGLLQHGVYPSQVCRRLPGLAPTMTVKARVVEVRALEPGEHVGYGMRWTATARSRIAVLPLGYGDGYPRLRNLGHVLIRGCKAPVVGGVTMDAFMVDVTAIPGVGRGDEAVLMGNQGGEAISAHDLARWKGSVSYDILCAWRSRLPRCYVNLPAASPEPSAHETRVL